MNIKRKTPLTSILLGFMSTPLFLFIGWGEVLIFVILVLVVPLVDYFLFSMGRQ